MASVANVDEKGGSSSSNSSPQPQAQQLPTALQLHIVSLLPHNERVLSGRLVCRDVCADLGGPSNCTAYLSQPLPAHAVAWAIKAAQPYLRRLPVRHKLQLLCTAATSGSEVNLEVALALVKPSVFPEVLQGLSKPALVYDMLQDPGVAVLKAGHPQLLGWLVRSCPALMRPDLVLRAAALHCDLSGLQATWEAVKAGWGGCGSGAGGGSSRQFPHLWREALRAAAASATPDAVAKMEWLLAAGAEDSDLQAALAGALASGGDLDRLRWLRERGCPLKGAALAGALEHAPVATVQWLVDEAGCELPYAGSGDLTWETLMRLSAKSADGVVKLQWLQARGAPTLERDGPLLRSLAQAAASCGRVEVMQHLLSLHGPDALRGYAESILVAEAAGSGSIPMLECLRQAGFRFTHNAYTRAKGPAGVSIVRWLAKEAGVSAAGLSHLELSWMTTVWSRSTPSDSRELLEAVQLLAGAGCRDWDAKAVLNAAERGDAALVQYLIRQLPRYRPDAELVVAAATGGCEALLEWLAELPGSPARQEGGVSAYFGPATNGDRGTLETLRRLGVPWGSERVVVDAVAKGCEVSVLRWLAEQGAPVGNATAMEAAVAGRVRRGSLGARDAQWLRGLAGVEESRAGLSSLAGWRSRGRG